MSTFREWIEKLHSLSQKQFFYLIGSIFIILLLVFLKGCSYYSKPPLYRIGRNINWPGLNLNGRERNMTAFSDELLLLIAKNEQIDIEVFSGSGPDLLNKLNNNTLDGFLSQQVKDSQTRYIFSNLYFSLGPVLIVPVRPVVDRKYKIIGTNPQSANAIDLKDNPTIQIQMYDNILKALGDLNDNQIDGALFPALEAFTYVKTFYPKTLRIGTPPLTREGIRLIALKTPKGEDLVQRFNQGLANLKEDGTYDALIEKWGLVNTEKIDN